MHILDASGQLEGSSTSQGKTPAICV